MCVLTDIKYIIVELVCTNSAKILHEPRCLSEAFCPRTVLVERLVESE